VRYKEKL